MTDHVVGVTGEQFAHEGHGNEVDRQPDVTTRRRSTIEVEAKARLPLNWEPVSGFEPMARRFTRSTAPRIVSSAGSATPDPPLAEASLLRASHDDYEKSLSLICLPASG
jgi:hypothetical protein